MGCPIRLVLLRIYQQRGVFDPILVHWAENIIAEGLFNHLECSLLLLYWSQCRMTKLLLTNLQKRFGLLYSQVEEKLFATFIFDILM